MSMGEDIKEWLDIHHGEKLSETKKDDEEIPTVLLDAMSVVKMVERAMPIMLRFLPSDTTREGRAFRKRLNLIKSSLPFCRFRLELKISDPDGRKSAARFDTIRAMGTRQSAAILFDTINWMERETKLLLTEAIESYSTNDEYFDFATGIQYLKENVELVTKQSGVDNEGILVRVPIRILREIGKDNALRFLGKLQTSSNIHVELYTRNRTVEDSKVYTDWGLEMPPKIEKTRQNTITLFIPEGDEFTDADLKIGLGEIGLGPKKTIVSPVRLENAQVGLIWGTIIGLRLLEIARQKRDSGEVDKVFVDTSLTQYEILCQTYSSEEFDLTNKDLIDIATGDKTSSIIQALNRLFKVLPIRQIDTDELRQIYERVEEVLQDA